MGKQYFIKQATKKKGALHHNLGVPMGKKIPAATLAKARHSQNETIRKEAVLATTLRKINRKK